MVNDMDSEEYEIANGRKHEAGIFFQVGPNEVVDSFGSLCESLIEQVSK